MKKFKGMRTWFIIGVAAVLIISVAIPVGAGNDNRKLYGEYAANFILSCGTCGQQFNTANFVAPVCTSTSTSYTASVQSIFTFDGKGNVSFTGRYLGVLKNPIPVPNTTDIMPVVLPQKLVCEQGTYSVFDDLTFEVRFAPCLVYADSQEAHKIHEISNFNLRGQLLDRMDGPVLLLTDTLDPAFNYLQPNIETVLTYPPMAPPPFSTTYRICGLTGTAIPIKEHRMKKGEGGS
jgi:hypothetical protein